MEKLESVDMSTKEKQAEAFNNNTAPCNCIKLINYLRARIEILESK